MSIFFRGQITVFFERPYWVAVIERVCNQKLEVCKITFGGEPKDYEVYAFIMAHYYELKFSAGVETDEADAFSKKVNPKRLQRQIKRAVAEKGIRTKAQEAIQKQRDASKLERKKVTKENRLKAKQADFELRQLKKKQKKRGH